MPVMAPKNRSTFYITTASGMRGHFAVMVEREPDGFTVPYQSSPITCETQEEAEKDGRRWAAAEGIPFQK